MSNEFRRIDLACTGMYIAPRALPGVASTAKYGTDLGPFQTCTLPGSTAGSSVVRGQDYIYAAFSYSIGVEWRNVGIQVSSLGS